ncbi:hypothetical protein AB0K48_58240, partial [Nonomuraea sp. NPDC055795]
MSQVRIVVADDHPVVRTGYAEMLGTQPGFTVVATAADGAEAVRACRFFGEVAVQPVSPSHSVEVDSAADLEIVRAL